MSKFILFAFGAFFFSMVFVYGVSIVAPHALDETSVSTAAIQAAAAQSPAASALVKARLAQGPVSRDDAERLKRAVERQLEHDAACATVVDKAACLAQLERQPYVITVVIVIGLFLFLAMVPRLLIGGGLR